METHLSNCIIFTLEQWFKRGGYIIIRKSAYGWWPHVLYSTDLKTIEDFVPIHRKRRRLFPPLLFRGYHRTFVGREPNY